MTELVGMFSGGKDSLVACLEAKVKEVLYLKTGVGLNEEYVREMCVKFNWKLNIVEPKEGESYENFVEKFSFPHAGMHSAIMGFLKWHPLRKWHSEQKKLGRDITFISGRRKKESARRKKMKSLHEHEVTEGMKFWSILYNWTTVDIWDYIKKHNLKRSPIYDTMHMSGDCMCGAFSARGESHWLSVFHPEMAERFRKLEEKYKGKLWKSTRSAKWGNQISITDELNQQGLESWMKENKIENQKLIDAGVDDNLICQECVIE